MFNEILKKFYPISGLFLLITFFSCKDSGVQYTEPLLIYEKAGLVDSAVVNGCYPDLRRYFTDTLSLSSSKIKIEFDGLTNSEGCYIKVYYNTVNSSNNEIYSVTEPENLNQIHSFEYNLNEDKIVLEIRLYINPPVCGQGEFKFTRVRNLKVYQLF